MIVHVLDWQVLEQTATSSLYILVTHLYACMVKHLLCIYMKVQITENITYL